MDFMKLFRRHDPLAALRAEPSEADRAALTQEARELRRDDILRSAPLSMSPFTNVAAGTWGYDVLALAHAGLLECRYVPGVLPDESTYRYSLTESGRKALTVGASPAER